MVFTIYLFCGGDDDGGGGVFGCVLSFVKRNENEWNERQYAVSQAHSTEHMNIRMCLYADNKIRQHKIIITTITANNDGKTKTWWWILTIL